MSFVTVRRNAVCFCLLSKVIRVELFANTMQKFKVNGIRKK